MALPYSDEKAANALVELLGNTKWAAVSYAKGYLALKKGAPDDHCARLIYDQGTCSLKHSKELISLFAKDGFLRNLPRRDKVGSAENPVTKLFPAAITEKRFIDLLDELSESRKSIRYDDDRETGHSLMDFTIIEGELILPINVKNAGTAFRRSKDLVGLEPDDCIPIPAYKANAAIDAGLVSLIYVVSPDYNLITELNRIIPTIFNENELIVWDLLNNYAGARVQRAEDEFIANTVTKYHALIKAAKDTPFYAISARKSLRILQTKPHRTPGIGLKAWGTGASAEVNVHLSIKEDMTPWEDVKNRIVSKGIASIVEAVNRKRTEEVYDPEI